jgi:hypothetical protein
MNLSFSSDLDESFPHIGWKGIGFGNAISNFR